MSATSAAPRRGRLTVITPWEKREEAPAQSLHDALRAMTIGELVR